MLLPSRVCSSITPLVKISPPALPMPMCLAELLMAGTITRSRTTIRTTGWTRQQVTLTDTAMLPRLSGKTARQLAAQPMIAVEQHLACGILCATTTLSETFPPNGRRTSPRVRELLSLAGHPRWSHGAMDWIKQLSCHPFLSPSILHCVEHLLRRKCRPAGPRHSLCMMGILLSEKNLFLFDIRLLSPSMSEHGQQISGFTSMSILTKNAFRRLGLKVFTSSPS